MELVQVRIKNVVVISLLLCNFNAVIKSSDRILCPNMLSIVLAYELKCVGHLIELQIVSRGTLIVFIKFL